MDDFLYSPEFYDEYRQIKYWANISIFIGDYNYKSGDAQYLNLSQPDAEKSHREMPSKSIVDHFNQEFNRVMKGDLPFYDTVTGKKDRLDDFFKKKKKVDVDDIDEFKAHEEARRNSKYGKNPGAVYCIISISRREFPVLYEIKTSIVARKDLVNRGGIEERNLGFSTPEHIDGELKRAITEHLEKLSRELNKIRKASQKQK